MDSSVLLCQSSSTLAECHVQGSRVSTSVGAGGSSKSDGAALDFHVLVFQVPPPPKKQQQTKQRFVVDLETLTLYNNLFNEFNI